MKATDKKLIIIIIIIVIIIYLFIYLFVHLFFTIDSYNKPENYKK